MNKNYDWMIRYNFICYNIKYEFFGIQYGHFHTWNKEYITVIISLYKNNPIKKNYLYDRNEYTEILYHVIKK